MAPELPAGALNPALVRVQREADCEQLAEVETRLEFVRRRYTEQHPEVQALRSEILRLRSALPADGTFCREQIEQRLRTVGQTR